jgi:hypothetical protein
MAELHAVARTEAAAQIDGGQLPGAAEQAAVVDAVFEL